MSALQQTSITPEQYLEIEFQADHKSEYFEGQMYAMAGALPAHVLLVSNLVTELNVQLRRRPCGVYSTDLKVRVSETGVLTTRMSLLSGASWICWVNVKTSCSTRRYLSKCCPTRLSFMIAPANLSTTVA